MADGTRTPEAALRTARWLFVAGAVFGLAAVVLSFAGYALFAVPLLLASIYCLMQAGVHSGWSRGRSACDGITKAADAHPWQEWNAYGNSCHYPDCQLDFDEHVPAGEGRG
ncbi:hypothetical protein AB0K35_28415 [Micromonospora sp. NPDC053740]|uniref:hypothetical protein n=1 Tax=Micromonospora sp. NPDC053740 TaxID=3155173 RepID=UPI00343B288E